MRQNRASDITSIKERRIISICRLGILALILSVLPFQSWARVTKIVESEITKVKEGKVVHTGKVLWFKNGQPAVVRVMLVNGDSGQVYDETITSQSGYYRLVGPKVDLFVMVQPVDTRRVPLPEGAGDISKITEGRLPWFIERIAKEIEDIFPASNYGYYPIVTSPRSKVVFKDSKAFLHFNKRYDYPGKGDEDVLNKECFECFDVAYAVRQYLFKRHGDKLVACYLCGTKISVESKKFYTGTFTTNHVLNYAIFRDPKDKNKFYKVLFDATPLNETLNPKVDIAVADIKRSHDAEFQQMSYSRQLTTGVPLRFIKYHKNRGFYEVAHLSLHDGILEYGFTIADISPGTRKESLKVHKEIVFSYGFHISRLKDVQRKLREIKPGESIDMDNLKKCGIQIGYKGQIQIPKECREVIANTFYWLVQKTNLEE